MPSDELDGERGDRPAEERQGDLFYRGTLIRLLRGSGSGVVRSATSGREIPFDLQHVALGGGPGEPQPALREGMDVGYDVGWTSRGLRVTRLFPLG